VTAVDAGSFRDPDSRVYIEDESVFRALSARGLTDYEAFAASELFAKTQAEGSVVRTSKVDRDGPAILSHGDATAAVLEHERIPFITYPYEWCFGMLKDAAALQLDLLDRAITEQLSLKDATPYNVQWVGTKPVFVDVGSFERLRGNEPWVGYRQFCTLYLYPLMLTAYTGVSFQPFLRGSLEGIEPADAAALLPRKKGVTINARLLARLERRTSDDDSARDTNAKLAKAGFKPEIIQAQVRRLHKLVKGLEWKPGKSTWSEYDADNRGYDEPDLQAKAKFVEAAAERVKPTLAWDLGANDGYFARVIAPQAKTVIAMDFDHETVEKMYRQLDTTNVTPLVVDLCDPSPARGWALAERGPLPDRGRPDLTLSLALIHHLSITRNIPMRAILEWLKSLGGTHVIEMPHRDDAMVKRLLSAKRDDEAHPDYNREPFEQALNELFEVRNRLELSSRTLYEVD
jgi:hypothetical protein